jgi:putative transposase
MLPISYIAFSVPKNAVPAYLIGIADNLDFKILAAGGTSNHIHLLIGLPPALTLATVVQKLKANSSLWRWLGENGVQSK